MLVPKYLFFLVGDRRGLARRGKLAGKVAIAHDWKAQKRTWEPRTALQTIPRRIHGHRR